MEQAFVICQGSLLVIHLPGPMMGGQEFTIYDTMLVFQENQGPGR